MVERLKAAVEKARAQRAAQPGVSPPPAAGRAAPVPPPSSIWKTAPSLSLNPRAMERNRIVTYSRDHMANGVFDVLRTRLLRQCVENGWRRIGVTAPTKGCGKSVTCANLALSLARRGDTRCAVLDFDLRHPSLARLLACPERRRIRAWLSGEVPDGEAFARVGENLALCMNTIVEPDSAEVLHDPLASATVDAFMVAHEPNLVLFDLPPLLVTDDAVGYLHNLDAVLLVVSAGQTLPRDVEECEEIIDGKIGMAGVVLNKHDVSMDGGYRYDYGEA